MQDTARTEEISVSEKVAAIRKQFIDFKERISSNPLSDDVVLEELCHQIEHELEKSLNADVVHMADDIYNYMGEVGLEKRLQLHRNYLDSDLAPEETFWSRWHLVDTLSVLHRDQEAIEEQSEFFRWTSLHMKDEHVLRAVEDTTQTQCWAREGRMMNGFSYIVKLQNALKVLRSAVIGNVFSYEPEQRYLSKMEKWMMH